jgi:hypothetical protein
MNHLTGVVINFYTRSFFFHLIEPLEHQLMFPLLKFTPIACYFVYFIFISINSRQGITKEVKKHQKNEIDNTNK